MKPGRPRRPTSAAASASWRGSGCATDPGRWALGASDSARRGLRHRQAVLPHRGPAPGDSEERTSERRVTDPPLAPGGPHDRVGDGQAEPRTAALLGGAVEAVEQPRPVAGRDATPAVLDGQGHSAGPLTDADPHGAARPGIPAGA